MENKISLDLLFSDIRSWATPVLERANQSREILKYSGMDSFKKDLKDIISFAFHMNFVEDSDPSAHLQLNTLAKYPAEVQTDIVQALRGGKDLCGYLTRDLNTFKPYQ
jgi:hypothetical protein